MPAWMCAARHLLRHCALKGHRPLQEGGQLDGGWRCCTAGVDHFPVCGGADACGGSLNAIVAASPAVKLGALQSPLPAGTVVQGLLQSLASLTLPGYPHSYNTTSSALLPANSFTQVADLPGSVQVWNVTVTLPGLSMANATGQHVSLWSLPEMLLSANAALAAPLLHVVDANVSPICGDGQCAVGESSVMQTAPPFDSTQGVSAAAANNSDWVTNLNDGLLDLSQGSALAPSGAGSLVALHSPWHCSADCADMTVCVPPTQRAQLAYALAVAHNGGWFGEDALPSALGGWQQAASSIVHLHVAVCCCLTCADILIIIKVMSLAVWSLTCLAFCLLLPSPLPFPFLPVQLSTALSPV